jgi:Fe-S-cluster-containing dehydrogenase component
MSKPDYLHFFIDPNRCIGCQACVQACTECDTHRGESMIHLEYVDRSHSVQTVPVVCMHCEQPTCAEVCPADAIKRTGDGVVQSARKPRCIACGNCVLACPFGVPELYEDRKIMMKCDMCYDRSSVGKKPMCATVCPSQALFFGTREQIAQREFVKFMVLTSFALTVGQVWIAIQNWWRARRGLPTIQRVASFDDVPVGGSLVFS